MSTEIAPYHAHIYYELDDRATAKRLHKNCRIRRVMVT